ncbi:ornithine decarboxylase [Klebsiella variicola]|uniref:Ornithine decarboxylase n=1 Tax=Klebsiella variicola TaxID=244366 RepID=A0A7H4MSA5_KLEVA|nr:ornithine decarboxylase [Klebsiella variicola]
MAQLVAMLGQFEQHIESDTPLADVLPTIYNKYPVRYRDYTLRELCQEMHDLYVSFDVKSLQKEMFRKRSFPRVVMNPQDANREFIRGNVELVRLSEAEGRVAAEGALPYPPGVLCVVPGEIWGGRYCAISSRWRRESICCRASHRSCRGFTARRIRMALSGCMATC